MGDGPLLEIVTHRSQSKGISILERVESESLISASQQREDSVEDPSLDKESPVVDIEGTKEAFEKEARRESTVSSQDSSCEIAEPEEECKEETKEDTDIGPIAEVSKETKDSNVTTGTLGVNVAGEEDSRNAENSTEDSPEKIEEKNEKENENEETDNNRNIIIEENDAEEITKSTEQDNTVKPPEEILEEAGTTESDNQLEEEIETETETKTEYNSVEHIEKPSTYAGKLSEGDEIPEPEDISNVLQAIPEPAAVEEDSTVEEQPQSSWGWFSSVLTGSPAASPTPQRKQQTKQASPPQETSGIKSFFGNFWQETSSVISEIITPPTERRSIRSSGDSTTPPRTPTPVRGKLRGFGATFDSFLGSVRMQALEMLSGEMKERIDELEPSSEQIEYFKNIYYSDWQFENLPPPYISEKAKVHEAELSKFHEKCQQDINLLKQKFSGEKTTSKNVVQHTNDSLHITHDKAQALLAELASLAIELTMRVGESFLIEPMLPSEELEHISVPEGMHKQEHQAYYGTQLLQRIVAELEIISETFVNFTFRIGTAGKVRIIRCCSDKDIDQFGRAIDAMTAASAKKVENDLALANSYVKKCKDLLCPVLLYLYLSQKESL